MAKTRPEHHDSTREWAGFLESGYDRNLARPRNEDTHSFQPDPAAEESRCASTLAVPVVLIGLGLFATGSLVAQSLGDVARQQKQIPRSRSQAPKKVITEDDLPAQDTISTGSSEAAAT